MQDVIVQNFPFNIYQKNNREVKVSLVLNFFMSIYSYICDSFMYRSDPLHLLLAEADQRLSFHIIFQKFRLYCKKSHKRQNLKQI